ncbi:MAG TPA: LysR substrate-binding domain-containing protein [Bacillota bacterium]|nr:LysR substrate-binding domain-containing protein [Bacillota bacterium]
MGVKLFERLGHRITLTSKGSRLLPFAEQILKLTTEAKDAMEDSGLPRGTLTVGAVESLCVMRLPKLLKAYRLRYPEVEIALKLGNYADFFRSMRENTMDIAFILEKKMSEEGFVTELRLPETMVMLAAPDHFLAEKDGVYPEDLSDQSFILTEPGCSYRDQFQSMLHQNSIKPRSIMETGNVQAIKQLVMSGLGITVLPLIAVSEECNAGRLVRLNWKGPAFEIFTHVVYHKDKWVSGPLKAFIEMIHEMDL